MFDPHTKNKLISIPTLTPNHDPFKKGKSFLARTPKRSQLRYFEKKNTSISTHTPKPSDLRLPPKSKATLVPSLKQVNFNLRHKH